MWLIVNCGTKGIGIEGSEKVLGEIVTVQYSDVVLTETANAKYENTGKRMQSVADVRQLGAMQVQPLRSPGPTPPTL